jgi:hypothetical protein
MANKTRPKDPIESFGPEPTKFHFDPLTGLLYHRGSVFPLGTKMNNGYLTINFQDKNYLVHRLGWFLHHGVWPDKDLDHINGIKDDNRIVNLREVSRSQNMHNSKLFSNSTTGHRGVRKHRDAWQARITINYKEVNLGTFSTIEKAIKARQEAEAKLGIRRQP